MGFDLRPLCYIPLLVDFAVNSIFLFEIQIKGPSGEHLHDFRDKTSEKHDFIAHNKGLHRFCFTNKSPYHETIDFDVHVGHFSYHEQHAKDGNMLFPCFILC